jgi:FMN phosphatase YigB (HAD superfamily)
LSVVDLCVTSSPAGTGRAARFRSVAPPPRRPVDRAVLFDFGGTLDADGVTWKERFARLYRTEGVRLEPARFDPLFYAADDALVRATPPTLSFGETVSRLAAALAQGLGLGGDDALVRRVASRFLEAALETLRRNTPLLSRLRGRYRLGIVSNFYGNLETVCDDAGIGDLFSVILDSCRVGCRKPDPRIFDRAVEECCGSRRPTRRSSAIRRTGTWQARAPWACVTSGRLT